MKIQYLVKGVPNVTVTMFSNVEDMKETETKAYNKVKDQKHNSVDEMLDRADHLAVQLFPGVVHKNNMKRLAEQGATDCRFIPV